MNSLTLCSLVYILIGVVSGYSAPTICRRNLGETCTGDGDCCDGVCVGGTCFQPIQPLVQDPCALMKCSTGYKCVLGKCITIPNPCDSIKCTDGHDCIQRRDDPTNADCVARNVCGGVLCSPTSECQLVITHGDCIEIPGYIFRTTCPLIAYYKCVPENNEYYK